MLLYYHTSEAVVNQTKTDANGYFKISYTKTLLPGYSYYISTSGGDELYYQYPSKKYVTDKKQNLEFYFSPIAYVKFHVINNTPNSYTVTVKNDQFNKSTTLTGTAFENKISSNYLEVSGNTTTGINWEYLNINYYGNVTVNQKHDTVIYAITLN